MPKVSEAHMLARREQILAGAMTCFTRNGVHPTSVADICREAGVSTGGLYRHFAGKGEIIEALFSQGDETNREALGDLVIDNSDPLGTLDTVLKAVFERIGDPEAGAVVKLSLALHAEAARDERIAALLEAQLASVTDAFSAPIREAQRQGELQSDIDPELVAMILVAIIEGLKPQLVLRPDLDVGRYAATVRALMPSLFRQGGTRR